MILYDAKKTVHNIQNHTESTLQKTENGKAE